MASHLYIVIVGCGRLGAHLANRLSREGHSVVIIDTAPDAFAYLSPDYSGFRVEGDATELAVLKQARIEHADTVIAATRRDNVNLMIAQVAQRLFSVPRVVARVFSPEREDTYRRQGIQTVCPTVIAGNAFLEAVGLEDLQGPGE